MQLVTFDWALGRVRACTHRETMRSIIRGGMRYQELVESMANHVLDACPCRTPRELWTDYLGGMDKAKARLFPCDFTYGTLKQAAQEAIDLAHDWEELRYGY